MSQESDAHIDCLPEGASTVAPCPECGAATGQQCASTCSTWSNILHVCEVPR